MPAPPLDALSPRSNRLLAALPPDEWARWAGQLEPVQLQLAGAV
jgi:hypothetical protein